ncbi:MAG: tetratricopeptide repeat protein [Phycisphaerales bacterium JB063]
MDDAPKKQLQQRALAVLALAAAALLIHALAINNPFLIDDHSAIQQHPDVQDFAGGLRLWTHHYWQGSPSLDDQLYRPVTVFSYWLSQRITPNSAAGFRIVNLLLLAGVALCVVSWLKRYAGLLPALIAGALVLTHPANTEAINHLVGRADLLAVLGVAGFLALQARAQQVGWTWPSIAGAAALTLIALGSKESGLALIPCALAQWWVGTPSTNPITHNEPQPSGGGPTTHGQANACRTTRGICPKRAFFFALFLPAAAYLAARLAVVGLPAGYAATTDDLTGNPLRSMGLLDRLPEVCAVAGWYVKQFAWPSTTYNHTPAPGAIGTWRALSFLGVAAYVVLIAGVAALSRKRRAALVPAVLFLAHLLIVGHLLTVTGAYAANRLTIATTMAGAMLVGLLLAKLINRSPFHRHSVLAAAILIALAFTFLTARANRAWSSELARMHADVQADDEDPIALYWLGQAQLAYDADAGVSHLKRAAALAPASNQAGAALADALLATGDDRAAWNHYDTLLKRNAPLTDPQRANAAMAAFNTGRYDRAQQLIEPLPDVLAKPIRDALEQVHAEDPE